MVFDAVDHNELLDDQQTALALSAGDKDSHGQERNSTGAFLALCPTSQLDSKVVSLPAAPFATGRCHSLSASACSSSGVRLSRRACSVPKQNSVPIPSQGGQLT